MAPDAHGAGRRGRMRCSPAPAASKALAALWARVDHRVVKDAAGPRDDPPGLWMSARGDPAVTDRMAGANEVRADHGKVARLEEPDPAQIGAKPRAQRHVAAAVARGPEGAAISDRGCHLAITGRLHQLRSPAPVRGTRRIGAAPHHGRCRGRGQSAASLTHPPCLRQFVSRARVSSSYPFFCWVP